MLYPKLEDCVAAVRCKYTLASVVSKRAKDLARSMPAEFVTSATKEITYALNEVVSGKISPTTAGAATT